MRLRRPRAEAVRVVPGLWIGGAPDHRQARLLVGEGIEAVVDLRGEASETNNVWPPTVEVVRLALQDHGSPTAEELQQAAETASQLMRRGLEVFVHCQAGLERSPTVACATLLLQGWPLTEAYRRVTATRPGARPTDGQLLALRQLAETIVRN